MNRAHTSTRHSSHHRTGRHDRPRSTTPARPSEPASVDDAGAGAQGWAWARAAQAGDQLAFANVYTRYRPVVASIIANRLATSVAAADVQDLTSEVFLRAWRGIGSVTEQRADPVAWLSVIARNAAVDHLKAAHTRRSEPVAAIDNPSTGAAITTRAVPGDWTAAASGPAPSAEAEAIQRARRAHAATLIHQAASKLTPAQQASVQAMLAEESSRDEATRTNSTVDAVKARRFRAVQAMRRHLAPIGPAAAVPTTGAAATDAAARDEGRPRAVVTRPEEQVPADHPAQAAGGAGGRGSRPHTWPCQHCGMVEDYRSTRETQIQLAEGRYHRPEGRDETYRPVVFKDWLQTYQWEREPDPTDPRNHHDTEADHVAPGVPEPRTAEPDSLTAARAAVDAATSESIDTGASDTRWDDTAVAGAAADADEAMA